MLTRLDDEGLSLEAGISLVLPVLRQAHSTYTSPTMRHTVAHSVVPHRSLCEPVKAQLSPELFLPRTAVFEGRP